MRIKTKNKVVLLGVAAVFYTTTLFAETPSKTALSSPPFAENELKTIQGHLFENIMTDKHVFYKKIPHATIQSIPGAVLASPSNKGAHFSQDYQFHWTRDAALTMSEVVYLYTQATASEKQQLKNVLTNYVSFEAKAQKQLSKSGEKTLGQPKFNIDGTVWEGKWMRPQNDGPALRATTMISIAKAFSKEDPAYVKNQLLPIITTDLNYVVAEWHNKTFDLWEEVKDREHFFTKMVQRKALTQGADLFRQMDMTQQAETYATTADQISDSLRKHWNENSGYLTETEGQQSFKGGGLDTSIILGVLHGDLQSEDDAFALNNYRVMSTVYFLRNAFAGLYKVNINHPHRPPLLGRYPNDSYDGDKFVYGNPWILTSNALAQYYYSLANLYIKQGQINITYHNIPFFQQINPQLVNNEEIVLADKNPQRFQKIINSLVHEGDLLLSETKRYSTCYDQQNCYHFSEQIDRSSGRQTSAKDLTWGYASFLTAMQARPASHVSLASN